jgi:hydrogenase/urease accessory protein HupE
MRNYVRNSVLAASAVLPVAAQAHPGEHPADLAWSLSHAFTQPDHLLAMAMVALWLGLAGCVGYWFKPWRKSSWTR